MEESTNKYITTLRGLFIGFAVLGYLVIIYLLLVYNVHITFLITLNIIPTGYLFISLIIKIQKKVIWITALVSNIFLSFLIMVLIESTFYTTLGSPRFHISIFSILFGILFLILPLILLLLSQVRKYYST